MEDIDNKLKDLKLTSSKLEESIQNVKNELIPLLNKYLNEPHIEIEARLGIYDEETNQFDSNIGDIFYNNIKSILDTSQGNGWKNSQHIVSTDYFFKKYRLSVTNECEQTCIEKIKLETINIVVDEGPIDIRITISKEIPVETSKFPIKEKCKKREKDRLRYTYKMWNFDLTKVKLGNDIFHELEIELENTEDNKDPEYLAHSLILKILDTAKMCNKFENIEDTKLRIIE